MTDKEIKTILDLHAKWLAGDQSGKRADLSGRDLSHVDLRYKDLSNANLSNADLSGAFLCSTNFDHANLSGANFEEADLTSAMLYCANLSKARLRSANLSGAYMDFAKLCEADLAFADLRFAYLRRANLLNAEFYDASMYAADLTGAKNIPFLPQCEICPSDGDFIGWKKLAHGLIAELLIPAKAKRSSGATGRLCRCSYAKVVAIYKGKKKVYNGLSADDYHAIRNVSKYTTTKYVVGKIVRSDWFDENRWNYNSHGINFLITRKEAEEYTDLILEGYNKTVI